MPEPDFDVVHVGSASRDLTDSDPRGWRLGGGVCYAALTTARLGLRTAAVVGVDRLTASAAELDLLRHAGVVLRPAIVSHVPVFRNDETADGRVQTLMSVASPLGTRHLPDAWRTARAWSLAPVAGEVSDAWAAVPRQALVALGWQGLLRTLIAGTIVTRRDPSPSSLVARADLIGVSRHDLGPVVVPADLFRLIKPTTRLVVTDGPFGGQLLRRDAKGKVEARSYDAIHPQTEIDPTGAGDVFLAALLAVTLRPDLLDDLPHRSADEDLRFAATAASFVVEAHGLEGIPALEAVRERFAMAP